MNDFGRTRAAVENGIAQGLHLGAQVYVSRGGEVLFDEAFGEARSGVELRRNSIMVLFSAGKPLTAVAVAQLVERGALGWHTPVAEVLPEFAANGKNNVTVQHLLTHTAGLRNADAVDETLSWDEKLAWICAQPLEPNWTTPGERAGYHVAGTWYVLGEIVRRRGGIALEEYLQQHVFQPLGMHSTTLALSGEQTGTLAERLAWVYDTTGSAPMPKDDWNSKAGQTRCRPGGSARGPVSELGRFYEAMLRGGEGVLRPDTVQAITSRIRAGMLDETFQFRMDWGVGFILNSSHGGFQMPYGYGRHASLETFGHSGNQASCAFADPHHQLVVAWACNGMPGERKHQARQRALNTAVYEDLGLVKAH